MAMSFPSTAKQSQSEGQYPFFEPWCGTFTAWDERFAGLSFSTSCHPPFSTSPPKMIRVRPNSIKKADEIRLWSDSGSADLKFFRLKEFSNAVLYSFICRPDGAMPHI